MIFVSPSLTFPPDLGLTTHDLCFADGTATVGAATWAKLAREPRWVDIFTA